MSQVDQVAPTFFSQPESKDLPMPLADDEVEAADDEVANILQKDRQRFDSHDVAKQADVYATPSLVMDGSVELNEETAWMFQSASEHGADMVDRALQEAVGLSQTPPDNASS